MDFEPAVKRLTEELARLEQADHTVGETDRRTTVLTLSIAGVLGLVIFGFLFANYVYFQGEWTEAKLSKSLRAELEVLKPDVNDQIRALGQHLAPVYVQEARRQLPDMAPVFARELRRQFDRLSSDFQADVQARLKRTESGVREKSLKVVLAAYPGMASEAEQAELTRNYYRITDQAVTGAIQEFQSRFARDAAELQHTLADFRTGDPEETTVDLQKKFIHLWLQLLDEEIMKL